MTFVVTTPSPEASEDVIENGEFFPAIQPEAIRAAQRIDQSITPERLRDALIEAMATANASLSSFRSIKLEAGFVALESVDAETIDGTSVLLHRYRRAVGCLAKANLIERYRDFDSTPAGDKKAETLAETIEDLRRDAFWAIADISGTSRTVVDLI